MATKSKSKSKTKSKSKSRSKRSTRSRTKSKKSVVHQGQEKDATAEGGHHASHGSPPHFSRSKVAKFIKLKKATKVPAANLVPFAAKVSSLDRYLVHGNAPTSDDSSLLGPATKSTSKEQIPVTPPVEEPILDHRFGGRGEFNVPVPANLVPDDYLSGRDRLLRECKSEFFGMFILVFTLLAGESSLTLRPSSAERITESSPVVLPATLGAAISVMIGVHLAFRISGGHVNPAFSFAMVSIGHLPVWKYPYWVTSQLLGAFAAAALLSAVYGQTMSAHNVRLNHYKEDGILPEYRHINETTFDPQDWYTRGHRESTGHLFATFGKPYLSKLGGWANQFISSGAVTMAVMATVDELGNRMPKALHPLFMVFTLVGTVSLYGLSSTNAINPARDLGPRLWQSIIGYRGVWSDAYWFWSVLVGTYSGTLAGFWFYFAAIAWNRPHATGDDLCPRCGRAECQCKAS